MTTPENKSYRKNYAGSGINKNFLTPCRRIGLSRTKKTPKNICAINETEVQNIQEYVNIVKDLTPVRIDDADPEEKEPDATNTKRSRSKKNKVQRSPKEVNDDVPIKQVEQLIRKEKSEKEDKKTSSGKKDNNLTLKEQDNRNEIESQDQTEENTENEYEGKCINDDEEVKVTTISCEENISDIGHTRQRKRKLVFDTDSTNSKRKTSSRESKQNHSEKANCLKNTKEKLKKTTTTNEENQLEVDHVKEENRKLDFNTDSASSDGSASAKNSKLSQEKENSFKEFQNSSDTTLARFTTEDYLKEFSVNPKAFYDNENDMDDFVTSNNKQLKIPKIKIQKTILSIKSSEQMKKVSDAFKAENKLKELSVDMQKLPNVKTKSQSKGDSEDEDDFVASPQTEQQKEDLIKLVTIKEKEIKEKQAKLERLKQAQVYKKKHSPEKLAVHSTQWLNGCKFALNDLLAKMQEHTSMDMECLIKNLKIPPEIINKLNL